MLQIPESGVHTIPDVASHITPETTGVLQRVGMEGIEVPVFIEVADLGKLAVMAKATAYVSLDDPEAKGIHMSRLFLELQDHLANQVLSTALLETILRGFLKTHEGISQSAQIALSYDVPKARKALVSDNTGWRAYPVTWQGVIDKGEFLTKLDFRVTYSSTCPCSAALARQLIQKRFMDSFQPESNLNYQEVLTWLGKEESICATPHGQRSHADLTIIPHRNVEISLDELIDQAERSLGTPVQTAVKREDEQEFARLNGENLMFAEDAARRLKGIFETNPRILDYRVKVSHLESLHPHDAVAIAVKGLKGGLKP